MGWHDTENVRPAFVQRRGDVHSRRYVVIKRIRINIPILDAEANAQGIAEDVSQLIIELNDAPELTTSIRDVLAHVLDRDASIAAVFINPFMKVRIAPVRPTVIGGFECALVRWDDLLAVLDIPCEQLILFAAEESQLAQLRSRLDPVDATWWRISRQNFMGALTHAKDIVSPVIAYEDTNRVLDILGNEKTIRRVFAQIG